MLNTIRRAGRQLELFTEQRPDDEPDMRRWVRRTGNDKWDQRGIMVDGFHEDDTPPSSWPVLGRCFNDRPHPSTRCAEPRAASGWRSPSTQSARRPMTSTDRVGARTDLPVRPTRTALFLRVREEG